MKELMIDWTRCEGHGLCVALLPASIISDEWGYPILRRIRPRGDEELIEMRRAVAVCPSLALRLEDIPNPPSA